MNWITIGPTHHLIRNLNRPGFRLPPFAAGADALSRGVERIRDIDLYHYALPYSHRVLTVAILSSTIFCNSSIFASPMSLAVRISKCVGPSVIW